ncbi:MAG: hypothetical protein LBI37_00920 [Puniceicoccales bacterium]|jgi:hypothetical protein|nr:hypothetical protein [Puniceicoccales bacterium]
MKSLKGSALIECILGISVFALAVTMLSQSFMTGMIIKKTSREINSNDMSNTMFIINSVLKKGYDIASATTGNEIEVSLPSYTPSQNGTSSEGTGKIKIIQKEQVKGNAATQNTSGSSGTSSVVMQNKVIDDLWKLNIEIQLGQGQDSKKSYTIYRYLPKATATADSNPPAATASGGSS